MINLILNDLTREKYRINLHNICYGNFILKVSVQRSYHPSLSNVIFAMGSFYDGTCDTILSDHALINEQF